MSREMATSGGEREERQAWTHDNIYMCIFIFIYINHIYMYFIYKSNILFLNIYMHEYVFIYT